MVVRHVECSVHTGPRSHLQHIGSNWRRHVGHPFQLQPRTLDGVCDLHRRATASGRGILEVLMQHGS